MADDEGDLAALPDRWHGPYAWVEVAMLRLAAGDPEGAVVALGRATELPQRSYSFHSWHAAKVREVRKRVSHGGGSTARLADADDEAVEEEMAALRAKLDAAEAEEAAAKA